MKRLFALFTSLCLVVFIYGQDRTITGKVLDANTEEPLPGVTVLIEGTAKGVTSDLDGNYSIDAADGQVLVFSYVGYLNESVPVSGQTTIDVSLAVDILSLDEVVVIGYGTQKKSLVTGAISQVGSEAIENSTVTRVEQALQGRAAGVFVAQNSGEPGAGLSIKIRGISSDGTNEPIYLVDGVRTGGLEYLNPSDIESMEILKDAASAAIYGAEGGNGVVLITTKKGKEGAGKVEYRFSYGIQEAVNLPSVMNAQEYKDYFLEATHYEGNRDSTRFMDLDVTNGTEWLGEIFAPAPMKEHQLSFSGGSEKSTYYLSFGSLDQDGIVGGAKNNLTRYTIRSNAEAKVKDWLSVGINASYSHYIKKPLDATEQYGGLITNALRYDPTVPVVWADDSDVPALYMTPNNYKALVKDGNDRPYAISELTAGEMWNPSAKIAYTERKNVQDKILGDIHANFSPVDWFTFTTRLYTDFSYQTQNTFNGRTMFGVSDQITHDTMTNATERWEKWFKYGADNFITVEKTFGNHYIQVMAGMNYENYKYTWLEAKGFSIPYGDKFYGYPNLGLDKERNLISGYAGDQWQTIDLRASYFGRAMYNYKERYMLQASIRRDGLSKFGSDEKYALFPSASLGWNINREDFFTSVGALESISNLKLRASWGKNGSAQNLSSFPYVSTLDVVNYADGTTDANLLTGYVPGAPGNNALKWETNTQTNIGLDVGVFRNALTFSVDWYKRTTIDQLADKSDLPRTLGFSAAGKVNNGEIENSGWEFIISYKGNVSDLNYNVSFNGSWLKNEVTKFGNEAVESKEGGTIGQLGNVTKYEAGQPVWYYNGYQAIGIFQDDTEVENYQNDSSGGRPIQPDAIAGDVIFADLNMDGEIGPEDRTYLGKSSPDFFYGFSFGLEYKGFDVQAFFQGVTGNQIFWAAHRLDKLESNRTSVWYEDRWTGKGTSNEFPRATLDDENGNYRVSSLNIYEGAYLRLKNLSIGYTLPTSITSKVKISRLKIYYTGTNLLTFTKYPGTDPEVGNSKAPWEGDQAQFIGVDNGMYPATKIHTVGVQVTF